MSTTTLAPRHDTAALASELVDRILHVQRQYKRETGRKLSYEEAFNEVLKRAERDEPVDGDHEYPVGSLQPLKDFLVSRRYCQDSIECALADANRCGTLQCSPAVNEEDRDEAEALLPEAPESAWKGSPRKGLLWGGMVCR